MVRLEAGLDLSRQPRHGSRAATEFSSLTRYYSRTQSRRRSAKQTAVRLQGCLRLSQSSSHPSLTDNGRVIGGNGYCSMGIAYPTFVIREKELKRKIGARGFEPPTSWSRIISWQPIPLVLRDSGPCKSGSIHLIRKKLFTKLFTNFRSAAENG